MCSRCPEATAWRTLRLAALATLMAVSAAAGVDAGRRVLRVAADPNNLPFSNDRCEGFENRVLELVARDLGAELEYVWHAQRRGFFRETMREGKCDLVAGVPRGLDPVLTTRPYYRSTYVMLWRRGRGFAPRSLDDAVLRQLTLGVQMIGDDFANTPPAHALARRGLVTNVRGFTVYGDYRQRAPPARIIDAVGDGTVDVAFVWGPLAGFQAREHPGMFESVNLPAVDALTRQPFAFDICMGVRRSERALRDEINAVLLRRRPEIDAVLAEFGVPRLDPEESAP